MRLRHVTLIVVPESPEAQITQFRFPHVLFKVLIALGVVMSVTVPGSMYFLFQNYHDMQQRTAGLPQLRKQVSRQQMLIEQSAENMHEIRTNLAQLQRAQARLPLVDSERPFWGLAFGMGGEEIDVEQLTDLNSLESHDNTNAYFLTLKKNIHQQQFITQRLEEYFDNQSQLLASLPSIWPVPGVGDISSKFGMRKHPITGQHAMHWGIDIGAAKGTPIVSTADGIVVFSGEKSTFGNVIVLDHGSGYTTFYGHCSTLEKQQGDRVKRGDIIARVGSSGRSTFNHLHYEIRVDGAAQDPLEFIVRME